MQTTSVKQLYRQSKDYIGQTVQVQGWIRTLRNGKNITFIELNDGSFFENLQLVLDANLADYERLSKLSIATGLTVRGIIVETKGGKQSIELQVNAMQVEAESSSDFPLQKKRHSLEYLRTIAHLRPRSNLYSAVFRLRSVTAYAIHRFFQEKDFVYVHSPIITGSDTEGAGEMFKVTTLDLTNVPLVDGAIDYKPDFFDKEANLSVSGQLEAEIFALAYKNVYTFAPTFRAENSNTSRHAAEFWMIEPEMAFIELNENMDITEEMIKYIIGYVLEKLPEEMAFFNAYVDKGLKERLNNVYQNKFERITYTQAIDYLKQSGKDFEFPVEWGMDLQTEHERYITEQVFKKPVFVTNYPKDIKAFYMRLNEDQKTVAAMDLLVPGVGEIVGGSQREERLDILEERINQMGLNKEDYWWYLELRKYGGVKHAGFGLGFERILMYLSGVSNIRDVIPFPRTVGNAHI